MSRPTSAMPRGFAAALAAASVAMAAQASEKARVDPRAHLLIDRRGAGGPGGASEATPASFAEALKGKDKHTTKPSPPPAPTPDDHEGGGTYDPRMLDYFPMRPNARVGADAGTAAELSKWIGKATHDRDGNCTPPNPAWVCKHLELPGRRVKPKWARVDANGKAYIVFRGTKTVFDVIIDMKFAPGAMMLRGNRGSAIVHSGMAKQLIQTSYPDHLPEDEDDEVVWCGHSLGGAYAVLAAIRTPRRRQSVITFGAPMVVVPSSQPWWASTSQVVTEFVHGWDLVPRAPSCMGPTLSKVKDFVGRMQALKMQMQIYPESPEHLALARANRTDPEGLERHRGIIAKVGTAAAFDAIGTLAFVRGGLLGAERVRVDASAEDSGTEKRRKEYWRRLCLSAPPVFEAWSAALAFLRSLHAHRMDNYLRIIRAVRRHEEQTGE